MHSAWWCTCSASVAMECLGLTPASTDLGKQQGGSSDLSSCCLLGDLDWVPATSFMPSPALLIWRVNYQMGDLFFFLSSLSLSQVNFKKEGRRKEGGRKERQFDEEIAL